MPGGRPSDYTPELADTICERIALGESLRSIGTDPGMPDRSTVLRWLRKHAEFRFQYARAREDQMEAWAEELVEMAEGAESEAINPQLLRIRVDTRKWLMSKLAPKKYSDKVDLNHGGSVTVKVTSWADDPPLVAEMDMKLIDGVAETVDE